MPDQPELPLSRVKLTLGQAAVIVSVVVGMGISWGVNQTSLQANREIMLRIEARSAELERQLTIFRNHQIVNEMLIDGHTVDIERMKQRLGLDGRSAPMRSALQGAK